MGVCIQVVTGAAYCDLDACADLLLQTILAEQLP